MVIVSVLGILSILMILNMQLSKDTVFNTRYLSALKAQESAYYLGISAAKGSLELMELEGTLDRDKIAGTDSLKDLWAKPIPLLTVGDTTISLTIDDLDRYFALNSLAGSNPEKQAGVFRRLLANLELNENNVNSVIDWLDTDTVKTEPNGSEIPAITSITQVKNNLMDSVEELFLIEHFQNVAQNPDANRVRGLLPHICVSNSGKININTAGKNVLMALDEKINEEVARTIIENRKDNTYTKLEELVQTNTPNGVAGIDEQVVARLQDIADVKSEFFRIKIEITEAEEKSIMTLVIRKPNTGGQSQPPISVISWKVE